MRNKLLKIFLLSVLAFGSILGIPINPKDVEDLLAGMNQAKERTIEEYDDSGDPDTTEGRKIPQNSAVAGADPEDADIEKSDSEFADQE